jgi:glycosyltransferase involved in cell wall biosynthesis
MSQRTLSVLMSVYNGEAFLAEAVESILNQTFRDFEFLIIDDGSTDASSRILEEYAKKDGRIRVLRQENKGRVASLNTGLRAAEGEYIARMDADDVALPKRLELQVEFLKHNPEVGLLGGAFEVMNTNGQILRTVQPPGQDAEIRSTLLDYNPLCHPTVMMKKETALAVDGYREMLKESEDYDLWLKMSERSILANLSEPMVRYRIHANQASVTKMRYQTECSLAAQAAARRRQRGDSDLLSGATELTPELLERLGVTEREIQQYLVRAYEYWTGLFADTQPETALEVSEATLRICQAKYVGRGFLGNAWLAVASLQYRLGKYMKALLSAGRAVLVRPAIAGRPFKRALRGLFLKTGE